MKKLLEPYELGRSSTDSLGRTPEGLIPGVQNERQRSKAKTGDEQSGGQELAAPYLPGTSTDSDCGRPIVDGPATETRRDVNRRPGEK